MEMLRAFIAIEIPPEFKNVIADKTASLREATGKAVRWVNPDNIHLTLKFFGEISSILAGQLWQTIQAECKLQAPFELNINQIGSFPNLNRPHIIWIGINAPPDLIRLQRKIEAAAAKLGYAAEKRPFSTHLTIGRAREQAALDETKKIHQALSATIIGDLGYFTVEKIILFKSKLQPGGAVYTPLYHAHLGNYHEKEII